MTPKAKILDAEEIRNIIREELDAHGERLGHDLSSVKSREEIRKDAEFLRRMRLRFDAIAAKIGYIILTAIVGLVLAIFVTGLKKVGH
jgi:hypothetical protein